MMQSHRIAHAVSQGLPSSSGPSEPLVELESYSESASTAQNSKGDGPSGLKHFINLGQIQVTGGMLVNCGEDVSLVYTGKVRGRAWFNGVYLECVEAGALGAE